MKTTELCAAAGITYRQADFWTRTGRLRTTPGTAALPGNGHMREYDQTEARVALWMGELVADGLTLDAAHDVARQLVEGDTARLGGFMIVPAETAWESV